MNKQEFKEKAKSTGASKCIYFNWSFDVDTTCEQTFLDEEILQKCVMLDGKKCKYAEWGL